MGLMGQEEEGRESMDGTQNPEAANRHHNTNDHSFVPNN
jgi:hypothetical protein